jgi:hypothetical protein
VKLKLIAPIIAGSFQFVMTRDFESENIGMFWRLRFGDLTTQTICQMTLLECGTVECEMHQLRVLDADEVRAAYEAAGFVEVENGND